MLIHSVSLSMSLFVHVSLSVYLSPSPSLRLSCLPLHSLSLAGNNCLSSKQHFNKRTVLMRAFLRLLPLCLSPSLPPWHFVSLGLLLVSPCSSSLPVSLLLAASRSLKLAHSASLPLSLSCSNGLSPFLFSLLTQSLVPSRCFLNYACSCLTCLSAVCITSYEAPL